MHRDWSTPTFDLPPTARAVGPFPRRDWLRTWWDHRGSGELIIADTGDGLVPLMVIDGVMQLVGEADLADYHSPLGGSAAEALAEVLATLDRGTQILLDSLPGEAATEVLRGLDLAGIPAKQEQHAVAAVLPLPTTFDEYLASIGKKERHEMRRKRRRFEEASGPPRLERRAGPAAVADFAAMHRRASGEKGQFMTPDMEDLFLAFHEKAGAVIDFLVGAGGRPVAAAFAFEDATTYYLYNSAYEPGERHTSPGAVLLSLLIEQSVTAGKTAFDFLKGDETYKFRHGATARPLYVVSGTVGTTA